MLDKVQLIQGTPPAAPGKCVVCGTTEGPQIDINFDIDFYGAVYFCRNCLTQVANALEYKSPSQWRMAQEELQAKRDEIHKWRTMYDELKSALDSANVLRDFVSRIDGLASVPVEDTTKPAEVAEQPVKQNSKRRPSNVQHDDSVDDLLAGI
jgi:hypothetical protein